MDDDCITYLVVFFLALVAIGFAGSGLAWLYQNELPYLITGVVLLCAGLVTWFVTTRPRSAPAASTAIVARAQRAERSLAVARHALERETEVLKNLRLEVRDEINFEVHRQAHRESRLIADRWYAHKHSAIATRKSISTGLTRMQGKKRQLNQRMTTSSSRRRRAIALEVQSTQSVIDALAGGLSSLNQEVNRGSLSLVECNQQTAKLRDHIRDHCGAKGQRWFNRLEARKRDITGR